MDRSEWVKIHPDVLPFTLRHFGAGTKEPVIDTLELKIADSGPLRHKEMPLCFNGSCQFRRHSTRFIYWESGENGAVMGFNLLSEGLLLVLLASFIGYSDDALRLLQSSGHPGRSAIVRMTSLLKLDRGHIVETSQCSLSKRFLQLDPSDCSLRVLGDRELGRRSIDLTECVLSLDQKALTMKLSFPSRTIMLLFSELEEMRSFAIQAINESSKKLASSHEVAQVHIYLQQRLDLISRQIDQVRMQLFGQHTITQRCL